jgi:hypothetical protein
LLALSLTLSRPILAPVAVGVNVTLIVHFALAAKLVVQVLAETAKFPVVLMAGRLTPNFKPSYYLLVQIKSRSNISRSLRGRL